MQPVGLANARISTTYAQKSPRSLLCGAMIGENRQLVTSEPVEFEKSPVEVQDCQKNYR